MLKQNAQNVIASEIVNIASSTENSVNGILSKTGKDAQDLFTDKAVYIFRNYPWFFKPIQDGTTNPRMELAFREPSRQGYPFEQHVHYSIL